MLPGEHITERVNKRKPWFGSTLPGFLGANFRLSMVMPDKPTKTAADLKLMIEAKLRAGHPECERAEVIINPPAAGRP
jgi:hypothetical protein